jgi:hypothetical protein
MIHAVMLIVAAGVMSDPYPAVVDVRRIRVVGLIAVVATMVAARITALITVIVAAAAIWGFLMVIVAARWCRAARWGLMLLAAVSAIVVVSVLRECRNRSGQQN